MNKPLNEIQEILKIAQDFTFKKGETIFKEGEEDDHFYIIMDGKVAIKKRNTEGVDRVIAELGAGEFFGENTLLQKKQKPATAEAVQEVRLMAISYDSFQKLIQEDPSAGVHFLLGVVKVVNERLTRSNSQLMALHTINKLLRMYRDDTANLARAVIENIMNITNSKEGAVIVKNPYSNTYRTLYSTSETLNETIRSQVDTSTSIIKTQENHHYLIASLEGLGVVIFRKSTAERSYIDEDLRLLLLVAEEFAHALQSAADHSSQKARQMLEQKRFMI